MNIIVGCYINGTVLYEGVAKYPLYVAYILMFCTIVYAYLMIRTVIGLVGNGIYILYINLIVYFIRENFQTPMIKYIYLYTYMNIIIHIL